MIKRAYRSTLLLATAAACASSLLAVASSRHEAAATPSSHVDYATSASANDAATTMALKILGLTKGDPSFGNVQIVPGGIEVDVVGTASSVLTSAIQSSQILFADVKIPVIYRTVSRSLAALKAVTAQITDDQQYWFDQGVFMSTAGPDAASNSVKVTLRRYAPEAAAAVTAKYGAAVTVSTQSDPSELYTNRFADSQPWFGADRIDIPEAGTACTSYFSLYSTQNSAAYNATAGHCGTGTAMNGATEQGLIVSSRVVWRNGGSTDVELWQVGSNGGDVWHSNLFRGVTSRSTGEVAGTSVCQDGMMTGESCGDVVTNPDAMFDEYENGVYQLTLQHQVVTQNSVGAQAGQPGDSGAPVYSIKSNGEAQAYGMVLGGTSTQLVYTPQRNIFGVYSAGLTFEPIVH